MTAASQGSPVTRSSALSLRARRLLAAAVGLVCLSVDLAFKAALDGALHHPRPISTVLLTAGLSVALVGIVPLLPSITSAVAAGIGAGGAGGNSIAALAWAEGVPDPFVVAVGNSGIAFNLADVFALAGTALLFAGVVLYVIRHPGALRRRL